MSEGRRVDHALVEELLRDGSLSFRQIAQRAGCSDWSVRSISRSITGDGRAMKRAAQGSDAEPLGVTGCLVLLGLAALFGGAIWLSTRGGPQNGGRMP
jgi:hypothetical protein